MRPHREQDRLIASPARFKVVAAGRRSGKTERAKRFLIKQALIATGTSPAFFAAAPTHAQAKRIYWKDLKAMIPAEFIAGISESELTITLITGTIIVVIGLDKPARIEGTPWNGGILDEYANMKPGAWMENVRPALADRQGWCWLVGVPEGRNHYYDRYRAAKGENHLSNGGEWDAFTWLSADILPASEIEAARRDLDPLTFQQEYEASFVNFTGQAYYCFDESVHCTRLRDRYNPRATLHVAFDFNVDPGVAVMVQELDLPAPDVPPTAQIVDGVTLFIDDAEEPGTGTAVLGEVHIPQNSNTPAVCRKIIADWGDHQGKIALYGDATGGARGTAQTEGSDWDLIKREMYAHYGRERVSLRVPDSNPTERSRINAMNTRLRSGSGEVHMMVDAGYAPNTVKDFEGVRLLVGGSGEIDKKRDPDLTHLTDALGYYVVKQFPTTRHATTVTGMFG
jgi:hypothetical protein